MEYKLLSLQDSEEWRHLLSTLPIEQQDIYFTPQYYYLYEQNKEGKARCFVFTDGKEIALYPFLINEINSLGYSLDKIYYDIQGAYGYNGIAATVFEESFIRKFHNAFDNYCKEMNIVAGFLRFHPLMNKLSIFFQNADVIVKDRETVVVDLRRQYDEIWRTQYSSTARNMIRKAGKLDYKIQIAERPNQKQLLNFIDLYLCSMRKLKAEKYYYFPKEYYESIFNYSDNNSFLFNVLDASGQVVCSSIFFRFGKYFHYHLSARSEESDNCANNFLINKAVEFAKSKGAQFLHLGGGRSSKEDDLLLKFKKSFSADTCPFYIGKKIYNKEIYNSVIKQWELMYPQKKASYNSLFLKYRY